MKIAFEIAPQRIADLMITAIESGDPVTNADRGGWCAGIFLESPGDVAPDDPARGDPWYANPRLYDNPDVILKIVEVDDETTGHTTDHVVGIVEISAGLITMAQKYPNLFSQIAADNIDAWCADIFLQCVCFGEEKYA